MAEDLYEQTGVDADTPTTPRPTETTVWERVAGARYPDTAVSEGSVTSFELDLYDVSFRDARNGVAAGAVCREPVPSDASDFEQRVRERERVPVIYSYTDTDGWREAYRGEGPGYVGVVAWLGPGRALAVGGTGSYPRREPNRPGPEWTFERRVEEDLARGAGRARAWLLEGGAWRELSDLADGMRGLSALDAWVGSNFTGPEFAVAGGLGQLLDLARGRVHGRGGRPREPSREGQERPGLHLPGARDPHRPRRRAASDLRLHGGLLRRAASGSADRKRSGRRPRHATDRVRGALPGPRGWPRRGW